MIKDLLNRLGIMILPGCILAMVILLWEIHNLQSENLQMRGQVQRLVEESQKETIRFEEAKKQSEIEIEQSKEKQKEILLAEVPKNCHLAIKWAIQQAKVFKG